MPPLKRYMTWGFLLADHLPHDLELPHVRLRCLNDEEYLKFRKSGVALQHPDIKDRPNSSGVAADFRIRSRWGIFAWVDALNEEDGYTQAATKYVPPVVALLSALTGDVVQVQLLRTVELDAAGMVTPVSPYTKSGFVRVLDGIEPLSPRTGAELRVLLAATRADQVGVTASDALAEGQAMEPLTGAVKANLEAVLLRYFFVIEGISKKVGFSPSGQGRFSKAEEDIVTEVRKNLLKVGTPTQHAKQMRQAVRKLDVVARKFLGEQIQHTGHVLGLDSATVSEALELMQLRNNRLGHAAKASISTDELQAWVARARPPASAFLLGYARSLVR